MDIGPWNFKILWSRQAYCSCHGNDNVGSSVFPLLFGRLPGMYPYACYLPENSKVFTIVKSWGDFQLIIFSFLFFVQKLEAEDQIVTVLLHVFAYSFPDKPLSKSLCCHSIYCHLQRLKDIWGENGMWFKAT